MARLVSRRTALVGAAALPTLAAFRRAQAQTGPIRIGIMFPLSGAQAVNGNYPRVGAEIAARQINAAGGVNGRKIEIIAVDDKASPNDAVAGVRQLMGDGVRIIVGGFFSQVALATIPVIDENGGILMVSGATSTNLTHGTFRRSAFRIMTNSHMAYRAQGKIMAQRYPDVLNWSAIVTDAEFATSAWAAFVSGLKDYYPKYGKGEVTIITPPTSKFGATDFKNQIAQLMNSPAQGMHCAVAGADAVTFLNQAHAAGLGQKMKVMTDTGTDLLMAKAVHRNMPSNYWSVTSWYYDAPDKSAMSMALYNDFVAETKDKYPLGLVWNGHASIYAYAAGIKAAGSTETEALIKALENVTFETASGPVHFRKEDHQSIPKLGFIKMGPSANDPFWEVSDYVSVDSAEFIEPPSPGKDFSES